MRGPAYSTATAGHRALLALLLAQAALGLALPSAYRDQGWVRDTWWGNDMFTLVVAVPLLWFSARRRALGSHRGQLLHLGALAYAVYNGAFYLLGAAINAFFPLYVALSLVAAVTLVATLRETDAAAISEATWPSTPRRLIGGYYALVAAALSMVWLGAWGAYIVTGRPLPGGPDAFALVAALDLTLMVPALATGGALLWQRHRWGVVLASIAGVQASMYLAILALNSVIFIVRGRSAGTGELPLWGPLALATTLATGRLIAGAGPAATPSADPSPARREA